MKTVIIGGVAGGATTAARLRRLDEKAEIVLFERGAHISYANCGLPYYIGGVIVDRDKLLLQTPESFKARYNIDIRIHSEVLKINGSAKTVLVRNGLTNEEYTESYDKLVISTGAEPVRPSLKNIDNERIMSLRNVADTDKIKNFILKNKPQKAVVVGGGFIGLEMVENLKKLEIETIVVEKAPQVMAPLDFPMAAIVHHHLSEKGIKLKLSVGVTGFEPVENRIKVLLDNDESIDTDMVIFSIGVRPEVKLAKEAGLKMGGLGGILVDEFLQTSDKNIYALGDAVEVFNPVTGKNALIPLAGPANKQARIVAGNLISGNKQVYKGSIGTSIARIFDLTVAATGVNSRILEKEHITHIQSFTHSNSNAGYYPNAAQMSIKINFDGKTGKLFGVQIVGQKGVDKRIDVFAQIIKNGGTVFDLQEFEHAYAPPYSSAKDAVNMAGFVAENIMNEQVKIIHWNEIETLDRNGDFLLDTRTKNEFAAGHIAGATNIPIDEIRNRLTEIPYNKRIIVYCTVGLRGYTTARVLMQNGFANVYNLSGGYKTWWYATLNLKN
ncbi:hypothetical protein AGMMS50239_28200 [Bacteroidia bacterium]|nr:hypothetical protein AGMMS50239_28200 [Bacteroidia bacterium]